MDPDVVYMDFARSGHSFIKYEYNFIGPRYSLVKSNSDSLLDSKTVFEKILETESDNFAECVYSFFESEHFSNFGYGFVKSG